MGLNATVLPGLGTFRMGNRLRGLAEMGVAALGTLLFCYYLIEAVGSRDESTTLTQAFANYGFRLLLAVALVLGSWCSGVLFAKKLFLR